MPGKGRPARTPEAKEAELVGLAIDLAEKRLREGTASAQEIVHLLKLGSSREKLEQEKLRADNQLLVARVDELQSRVRSEEKYQAALEAFSRYHGEDTDYDFE